MLRSLPVAGAFLLASCGGPASQIQKALEAGYGKVTLPPGIIEVRTELRVPAAATNLEVVGSEGTILRAADDFVGRAVIFSSGGTKVKFRNFTIDGNRAKNGRTTDLPPASTPFVNHFQGNGLMISNSTDVEVSNVHFREVPGFAILASTCKKLKIDGVTVQDSGSYHARGRNNTSGGILIEEGTNDFEVRNCDLRKVMGNGVWTHSTFLSPRNYRGVIEGNRFENIGRDAIQVGHANRVQVLNNRGKFIGYPFNVVDLDGLAIPVAIDTAGKVDESTYSKNTFEEINGKCIDLDGFHDGEVSENHCVNKGGADDYPAGNLALVMNNANRDMRSQLIVVRDNVFDGAKFGAMFVIGSQHKITGNKLLNLNKAKCNESAKKYPCQYLPGEPDILQAGIYLGARAERPDPARGNLVEGNTISGHMMKTRCVMSAPTVPQDANIVRGNICTDAP